MNGTLRGAECEERANSEMDGREALQPGGTSCNALWNGSGSESCEITYATNGKGATSRKGQNLNESRSRERADCTTNGKLTGTTTHVDRDALDRRNPSKSRKSSIKLDLRKGKSSNKGVITLDAGETSNRNYNLSESQHESGYHSR